MTQSFTVMDYTSQESFSSPEFIYSKIDGNKLLPGREINHVNLLEHIPSGHGYYMLFVMYYLALNEQNYWCSPLIKWTNCIHHCFLSFASVTEVSDDMCGSGNYTAEMSLTSERGVEPGDAVPAIGNIRVVINLKTNNSRINLEVTSCCLSPTIQPDLNNSTCCLFSRYTGQAEIRWLGKDFFCVTLKGVCCDFISR